MPAARGVTTHGRNPSRRRALSSLLALAALASSSGGAKPLPICTSCAQFCATPGVPGCTLAGPANQRHIPGGTPRNFSVVRMTPSSVRGLANKNTGDPAGDLTFVLGDELAVGMYCRHLPANASRKDELCNARTTPSWLNRQQLVYVQWRVEHDGVFASYQQCNLLNTSRGDPANASAWGCAAAAGTAAGVQIPGNASDAALCAAPACAATLRARLGWEDRAADSGAWQPAPPPPPVHRPSAACVRAVGVLCGNATRARGFTGCAECLASAGAPGAPLRGPCTYREIANGMGMPGTNASLCPAPRPLPAACVRDAALHCGALLPPRVPTPRFGPANWSACRRCVGGYAKNATAHWNPRTSTPGPCGLEPRVAHHPDPPGRVLPEAVVFGVCRGAPAPSAPPPLSNATWPGKGWLPNSRLVRRLVQGSWFSTPSAGECVGGQRPGDGSGCAWRAVQMQRVVNYSCANARVGAAVIARNPPCFGRCSDGGDAFPHTPSDCWTRCFYNTLLGNTTFGDPGLRAADVVVPFADAFKPEADGGCPGLPPLPPRTP